MPVLYSFRRCPYAIRARLALRQAGLPIELREVALRRKPPEMLALSPKGTVPVLQLPDGRVLDESLDIMRWALQQADPEGWLDAEQNTAGADLIALNDGPFKALLDRYKYPERHPERRVAEYRQEAVDLFIGPLNLRLAKTPFLLGPKPSFPDMAIVPFIRQFAQVDADWFAEAPLAALQTWLQGLTGSALFQTVMQARHAPWTPGQDAVML